MLQPVIYQENMTFLKLGIAQKSRELTARLTQSIDAQAEDLYFVLQHDIEWCGDPKAFYEKELPYRLDSIARRDLRHLSEMISQGFTNNLCWLQDNLRRLGIRNFNMDFQDYQLRADGEQYEKLNLIDIHKTKLMARVGTLITAICFSGFGLGVFAASILGGIFVEEGLLSRSKKSKQQILNVLPTIVDNYKEQLKIHIIEAISLPKANIINTLNNISYEQIGV